jgi:hypothetical protein
MESTVPSLAPSVKRWEAVISSQFGRLKDKDRLAIACNLTAVDVGLKPAFLWDVAAIANETVLRDFLKNAHAGGLTRRRLKTELLHGEHFVLRTDARFENVDERVTGREEADDVRVIDVADGEPKLLSVGAARAMRSECPCLAWGLALGFPVVYATGPDTPAPVLAGVDVQVVELVVVQFWSRKTNIVISSFSYPKQFEAELTIVVGKWVEKVKTVSQDLKEIGLVVDIRNRCENSNGGLIL